MRLRAPALAMLLAAASACGAFTASEGPVADGGADAPPPPPPLGVDGSAAEDGGKERDGGGDGGGAGGLRIHEQNPFGSNCAGWTAGAGTMSVAHVPDGHATPGACRVCPNNALPFSVTGPLAEKVVSGPPRRYTFKASVRRASVTASSTRIMVGIVVNGTFESDGAIQNPLTWTEDTHVQTAGPGAEIIPAVYADPTGAAECFDIDDVSLVSTPAP